MAPKDEDVYNDALKASGDEALAKAFLKAFQESTTLKTKPPNNEKLQVRERWFHFSARINPRSTPRPSLSVFCTS